MDEDPPPRRIDDALASLLQQDLDRLSVAELDDRIAALEGEIARTRLKRDGASNFRTAADKLFKR